MRQLQIFKIQSKIEDDDKLLPCAPYPQSFFIPRCLSRSQINSSRNKKNPRNWKDSVSVRVLDNHHIKFFMDVYKEKHLLLHKNMCCANQSRLKKSPLWQSQFVTKKMICQKTKNTSKKEQMKGKTISYLKNICEPYFFQTTC